MAQLGRHKAYDVLLSLKLVNKSTRLKHHHVYTNVYSSHSVLYTCVSVLAVLISPMWSTVPANTCLFVCLTVITGVGWVLIRVHQTTAMLLKRSNSSGCDSAQQQVCIYTQPHDS